MLCTNFKCLELIKLKMGKFLNFSKKSQLSGTVLKWLIGVITGLLVIYGLWRIISDAFQPK